MLAPMAIMCFIAFPGSLIVAGVPAATGWRQLFISRIDGSDIHVVALLPSSSYGATLRLEQRR